MTQNECSVFGTISRKGDILSKIPFSYFGDDGEQKYFVTEALVLSTSCHIDRKNSVGFFAKTDVDVERYREFKPFSDTVIVIDYVLGNEDKCATMEDFTACIYMT